MALFTSQGHLTEQFFNGWSLRTVSVLSNAVDTACLVVRAETAIPGVSL